MISFEQPYPSARSPVCAANLVASSQPLAVQSGIRALRRGGNAVDAALATAISLTVVEPNNNGVGSDAFALLWDGKQLVGLNGSGRAPAGWTRERFAGRDQMPALGWDAVTVPGAVSAWVALSQRYGRLPFEDLFTDAIAYAERGFQVGPKTAWYWQLAAETYAEYPEFSDHFLPAPGAGRLFRRPDLARTLATIADSRGQAFYEGGLAERIERAAIAGGGAMRASDLAAHRADWVQPTRQMYRDVTLHEIPPNGQGLAAQIALGILRHLSPGPLDSAALAHQQIEAMKIAIRAAFDHFADPESMLLDPEELLGERSLARVASSLTDRASTLPPPALPMSHDTVYLTAADANGMMVSFIQSNYMGFGSGIVIPGTGISMQNRGAGFSLEPGHPNEVGPGKRPFHTIIPGFVTDASGPRLSFGVMGGHMQHQGHVQMVSRIFDHGQNPQAASDAPRWHVYPDFTVGLEERVPESVAAELSERGHQVRYEPHVHVFGGAQLILKTEDGYVGGSDHRKEGQVAGF
ncbi:MAG: gamma-glutamyltransferase family protein [Pseudomonadales bacterium]|nr:gamma-glutamyltransferase family protein [Pseudomonadales bacterium]MDP6473208.1 gamma-glutamyltransferase family protein [Pseudomonadales bacterium]MDP6826032.1 gamma-glutamyltransferase family protein [Pseudomonadales bacterium]MDP6973231.1 gamma-glutamyltransferase family protein [Pseudomonadales bacterium]